MYQHGGQRKTMDFMDECYVHYYRAALPLDTNIIHGELLLQASLHTISPNIGHKSTLSFFDKGIAKIETRLVEDVFSYPDNEIRGGWFDRVTSEKVYHDFINLHIENWANSYVPIVQFTDGVNWELNIRTGDGVKMRYGGYDAGPDNWNDVQRLFNISAKLMSF